MENRQHREEGDRREDMNKTQADSGQETDEEDDKYVDYSDSDFI